MKKRVFRERYYGEKKTQAERNSKKEKKGKKKNG